MPVNVTLAKIFPAFTAVKGGGLPLGLKKREFALMVEGESTATCVLELKGVPGSLKPMWAFSPMPRTARSMPVRRIFLSYSLQNFSALRGLESGMKTFSVGMSILLKKFFHMKQ